MRLRELHGPADEARVQEAWKRRLAAVAHLGSVLLRRIAISLASRRGPRGIPEIEFYLEAGAPEGALFVDGDRVGSLPGVTRL